MTWTKFKENQKVTVTGWMGMQYEKGTVVKECTVAEGTCLVLFEGCERGVWVPVKNVKEA